MTAVRTTLAVLLAAALLAASLPAIDDAARENAHERLRAQTARVERAARALTSGEDATAATVGGAHRSVAVSIPEQSLAVAGVRTFAVGGAPGTPGDRPVVVYSLADGTRRTLRLDGVPLRTPGGPVVLGPGRHRLTLSLRADADGVAVVVRR